MLLQFKAGSFDAVNRSNCDSAAANILRTHYSRPYFLPDEAESSRTDWIFMGSPGFGARLHVSLEDFMYILMLMCVFCESRYCIK